MNSKIIFKYSEIANAGFSSISQKYNHALKNWFEVEVFDNIKS